MSPFRDSIGLSWLTCCDSLDCCEVKVAICIVLSTCGANVAMFAQKFHQDYTYAVEIVILSTLMSVVTLPMIVYAAQIVL